MKDCFIIMPITTPDFALDRYARDKYHFRHVLDHLFIPAIEKAELNPIPPITKGAEPIQGDIIKNLETADLVMCDISCLNPNVFFELGIRTALNRPTCLVRDDTTEKIPFDTTIINHYDYKSSLHAWELAGQVESLTNHIKDTIDKTDGQNALWKYFGITMTAEPSKDRGDVEAKLDILSKKIDSIRGQSDVAPIYRPGTIAKNIKEDVADFICGYLGHPETDSWLFNLIGDRLTITLDNIFIAPPAELTLQKVVKEKYNLDLDIKYNQTG